MVPALLEAGLGLSHSPHAEPDQRCEVPLAMLDPTHCQQPLSTQSFCSPQQVCWAQTSLATTDMQRHGIILTLTTQHCKAIELHQAKHDMQVSALLLHNCFACALPCPACFVSTSGEPATLRQHGMGDGASLKACCCVSWTRVLRESAQRLRLPTRPVSAAS